MEAQINDIAINEKALEEEKSIAYLNDHLEKYKLAPPTMPDNLHWFKWEAYFTWLSGMTAPS